mmetsp:Transcript_82487/g.172734  ORF Transcript_82487/g.172734 Transcript_82487/m.172734 type:complete len:201 (+) Transcript_82487:2-604(+)
MDRIMEHNARRERLAKEFYQMQESTLHGLLTGSAVNAPEAAAASTNSAACASSPAPTTPASMAAASTSQLPSAITTPVMMMATQQLPPVTSPTPHLLKASYVNPTWFVLAQEPRDQGLQMVPPEAPPVIRPTPLKAQTSNVVPDAEPGFSSFQTFQVPAQQPDLAPSKSKAVPPSYTPTGAQPKFAQPGVVSAPALYYGS